MQWLADRSITPYMRTRDSIHRKNSPFYGPERFTYQPESNSYRCPAGQPLNYGGRSMRNRTYAYIGTRKRCGACALKAQCTSGAFRFLAIHMDEPARQRARELANTPEFAAGTAAKKEGGSLVRGTQESDRTASLAPAEIEVRAGAVLPGSGGPEHQATRAVPQPTDNNCSASHHLAELREDKLGNVILPAEQTPCFSTPTRHYTHHARAGGSGCNGLLTTVIWSLENTR